MAKKRKPEPVHRIVLTERQFHTVIAALRCWQEIRTGVGCGTVKAGRPDVKSLDDWRSDLRRIASNAGAVDPLGETEIEALIQSINHGD